MNKKGALLQEKVIGIIIFIIVAAIIIYLVVYENNSTKGNVDAEICHQSIISRSLSIEGLQPGQALMPIKCQTQEIKIDNGNEGSIEKTVADAMYDCWWMVSDDKGNPLDFFNEDSWREVGFFGTSKANCIICSTIKFGDNLKKNPQPIDLMGYLAENTIPLRNITYLEYFTGENSAPKQEVDAEPSETDQDMAVVFMSMKGDNLGSALRREGAMIGGLVIGGFGLSKFFGGFGSIGTASVNGVPLSAFSPLPAEGSLLDLGEGAVLQESVAASGGTAVVSSAAKANFWVALAILATITAGQLTTMWTSMHAAAIHCDGNKNGCSGVFVVPLNKTGLIQNCQNIQSIP